MDGIDNTDHGAAIFGSPSTNRATASLAPTDQGGTGSIPQPAAPVDEGQMPGATPIPNASSSPTAPGVFRKGQEAPGLIRRGITAPPYMTRKG